MSGRVDLSIWGDVAVLTIGHPPVNALSHAVRQGLHGLVEACGRGGRFRAMVITGDGSTFPAGADIREFGRPIEPPMLNAVIAAIEASPIPVIAAIHGTAFGGGLELAMGCHQRIATMDSRLGLPEVKLGVMPGGGGTQRLPRLVGIEMALDMILTGRPVTATHACAAGLVDRIAEGDLLTAAIEFARECAGWPVAAQLARNLERKLKDFRPATFDTWRKRIADQNAGEVAPVEILKSIGNTLLLPFDAALREERAGVAVCMASPQSAALRYLFFAERDVRKVSGATVGQQPIRTIVLAGRSPHSPALASMLADSGLMVVHWDAGGTVTDELAAADLVIVAGHGTISGDPELVGTLDRVAAEVPVAILGQSQGVDAFASLSARPERVFGLKVFPGSGAIALIEIVRGRQSLPAVLAAGLGLGRLLGISAVVVGDQEGLVANRMLCAYLAGAERLARSGIAPAALDRALRAFGMRDGPFGSAGSVDEATTVDDDIVERCFARAVDEGARILEAGLVERASDIDFIWASVLGFPRHRGGLMYWADTIGLAGIVAMLETDSGRDGGRGPSPLLARLARLGRPIHEYRRLAEGG